MTHRLWPILAGLALVSSGCGVADQPASLRTVAAYEVPLSTPEDRAAFQNLLSNEAVRSGFHLDAESSQELRDLSEVSPMQLNVAVWRDSTDSEDVASAIDGMDHPGRTWITFSAGSEPLRFARFRRRVMSSVRSRWPGTVRLPVMPNGAIPLH